MGGGVAALNIDKDYLHTGLPFEVAVDDRFTIAAVIVGYEFNEYFAVEGRYNTATQTEEVDLTEDISIDVDYVHYGLYGKASYPTEYFTAYALAGVGKVSSGDYEFEAGVGTEVEVYPGYHAFVDYVVTEFDSGKAAQDITTVGIRYTF